MSSAKVPIALAALLAASVPGGAQARFPGAQDLPADADGAERRAGQGDRLKDMIEGNSLLRQWKAPHGAPPFGEIGEAEYLPAFRAAMDAQMCEIADITLSKARPTFANTIAPLAMSGELLAKVRNVFFGLLDAESTPGMQRLAEEVSPMLSAHEDGIHQYGALFGRVSAVYGARAGLRLGPEESMLLEKTYRDFVRGGAGLPDGKKARLRELNAEIGLLSLRFSDNLLKETNAYALVIDNRKDLAGLPDGAVAAAAEEAASRGLKGRWAFTLKGPSIWPFLQHCQNRDLRRKLLAAYSERCNGGGETDNKAIMSGLVSRRAEKARLLGYRNWAHHQHDVAMAKTPENVRRLLGQIWPAALEKAKAERAELQAMLEKDHPKEKLLASDWRYYAEKLRKAKFGLDEEEVRPYFSLDSVRNGAFEVCRRLYGITFRESEGAPVYHPEVRAFEVRDAGGGMLGLLYADYHPRPGKRGGAWMGNYRDQWIESGADVRPVVANVGNFTRPAGGAPALLTADEVETLFHELGHALHGLLSQCAYRPTSGTNVPIDFVELPSQILENWAFEPEVLKTYARHWKTGEAMPQALADRMAKAAAFNQGFAKTEYLAAALLDMDLHTIADAKGIDVAAFERRSFEKMGLIPEILSRYRTTYFLHSASDYSAGYYSYIWSEVLDSDAFQAFKEKGDIFDPATAGSFRKNILEAGGSRPAMEMYKSFRGAEPSVEPLLKRAGLAPK